MFCTEPLPAMILFFRLSFHNLRLTRSFSKYLFTTTNSPERVLRVYMFEVNGSKHSLLPSICEVEAVGIGATSKELRTPYFFTSVFSSVQSQREEGVTSHIS